MVENFAFGAFANNDAISLLLDAVFFFTATGGDVFLAAVFDFVVVFFDAAFFAGADIIVSLPAFLLF